jgi:hypothetical protein
LIEVRFKLGQYFQQGSHKVALSLPELVSQTNNFSVKNRPGCSPSLEGSNPKELYLAYNVTCTLATSDPNGHDVKVRFDLSQVKDEATAKNLDVAVNCTCPAFLYWGGQWNSHQRDALEGEPRPLLTAPTERLDLRDGFVICKHIKAVSERILPSVQHNIVKILRQRDLQKKEPTPSRLEEKQREMRERQKQKPVQKKRDLDVRKQLEQGIKNREIDDVVKRDTPATPEEKERVPVLPSQDVPAPDAHAEHVHQDEKNDELAIPELDLDDTTPEPAPAKAAPLKPQKMPQITPADRVQMQRMLREEQKRQNREINQRLRNNPGRR